MSSHPKVAQSVHEILDVIRHRWSPRAFDVSRDVSRTDLRRLFEAARWAPSSRNEQPWRFVVTERNRTAAMYARLMGSLTSANQAWAAAAPALVLVAVRPTHERDEQANSHAWYDAGQAVAFLTLQATAAGLSVRQMQGFEPAAARSACGVPAPFEPAVVMAIGYVGDPSTLVRESHRAAEVVARERRPLDELVYEGEWGRPMGD